MDFIESCMHNETDNGYCIFCGLQIQGDYLDMKETYTEQHNRGNVSNIGCFETDLMNLDLPVEIKELALQLAKTGSPGSYRREARKNLLFNYVYKAYIKLNINVNPYELINMFDLSKQKVNEALRVVSGTSTKSQNSYSVVSVVVISPIEFIKQYGEKLDCVNKIVDFALNAISKDKKEILITRNPQHMAIAFIMLYFSKKGEKFVPPKTISKNILQKRMQDINSVI